MTPILAVHSMRARSVVFALAFLIAQTAKATGGLKIEALRGNGANNNPALGLSLSPAVRVLDASGKPVPKALVVFTSPTTGPRVEFGTQGETAETVTDEFGVAVSPRLRPLGGNGPVEIRITASQGGEFAHCVVHQMNVGLGDASRREMELSLVKIPELAEFGKSRSRRFTLRLRIEDGMGRPLVSADVLFILRRLDNSGKVTEVSRVVAKSDAAGEATGEVLRPSGNGHLEFSVSASSNGRVVTAYFPVD